MNADNSRGCLQKRQDEKFDRQNLREINLQGANLADASFIGTDLSLANLQDTDLSEAKLVQAQLDGTNFTGATLSGAYIQDWNITSDTKFDGYGENTFSKRNCQAYPLRYGSIPIWQKHVCD